MRRVYAEFSVVWGTVLHTASMNATVREQGNKNRTNSHKTEICHCNRSVRANTKIVVPLKIDQAFVTDPFSFRECGL